MPLHKRAATVLLWCWLFGAPSLLALNPELAAALEYRRDAVGDGEYWRIFMASATHVSLPHFLLNMAGLALLVLTFRRGSAPGDSLFIFASGVFVFVVEHFFLSHHWARGMSGALHAYAAFLGCYLFPRLEARMLLAGIGLKLFMEASGGMPGSGTLIGAGVLTSHHLIGALFGAAAALATATFSHKK